MGRHQGLHPHEAGGPASSVCLEGGHRQHPEAVEHKVQQLPRRLVLHHVRKVVRHLKDMKSILKIRKPLKDNTNRVIQKYRSILSDVFVHGGREQMLARVTAEVHSLLPRMVRFILLYLYLYLYLYLNTVSSILIVQESTCCWVWSAMAVDVPLRTRVFTQGCKVSFHG